MTTVQSEAQRRRGRKGKEGTSCHQPAQTMSHDTESDGPRKSRHRDVATAVLLGNSGQVSPRFDQQTEVWQSLRRTQTKKATLGQTPGNKNGNQRPKAV